MAEKWRNRSQAKARRRQEARRKQRRREQRKLDNVGAWFPPAPLVLEVDGTPTIEEQIAQVQRELLEEAEKDQ